MTDQQTTTSSGSFDLRARIPSELWPVEPEGTTRDKLIQILTEYRQLKSIALELATVNPNLDKAIAIVMHSHQLVTPSLPLAPSRPIQAPLKAEAVLPRVEPLGLSEDTGEDTQGTTQDDW